MNENWAVGVNVNWLFWEDLLGMSPVDGASRTDIIVAPAITSTGKEESWLLMAPQIPGSFRPRAGCYDLVRKT